MIFNNLLFLVNKNKQNSYDLENIFIIIACLFLSVCFGIIFYAVFTFLNWKYKKKYFIFLNKIIIKKFLFLFFIVLFLFSISLISYILVLYYQKKFLSILIVVFFFFSFALFFIFTIFYIVYLENNLKNFMLVFSQKTLCFLNFKIYFSQIKLININKTIIEIFVVDNIYKKKIILNFSKIQIEKIKKFFNLYKLKFSENI